MALVHQHDQVFQSGEIIEVALADVLAQPLDAGGTPAPHLAVDLRDVEDVDVDIVAPVHAGELIVAPNAAPVLIGVAGHHERWMHGKFADPLEDILRRVGREIGDQLVVDREVRSQHEEVADALGLVEVGDERTHEPCFPDACGNRKAQRWEVPFKVLNSGKLALDRRQSRDGIGVLRQLDDLTDPDQDFERVPLGRPEAQAIADRVDVLNRHDHFPPVELIASMSKSVGPVSLPLPNFLVGRFGCSGTPASSAATACCGGLGRLRISSE